MVKKLLITATLLLARSMSFRAPDDSMRLSLFVSDIGTIAEDAIETLLDFQAVFDAVHGLDTGKYFSGLLW